MDQEQDANGQAQAALARVVQSFGVPVLGQADMLEGLLNDDVPQLTRQIAMLTEAARCGMAGLLAGRVKEGVSAQSAVSMVVIEVTSRSAMDTAGALWAAQAFAAALGYEATGLPTPAADSMPPVAAPPTFVVNRGGPILPDAGIPPGSQETIRPGAQPWPTNPDFPSATPVTSAPPVPPGQSAPQPPTAQQWPPQAQQWPPQVAPPQVAPPWPQGQQPQWTPQPPPQWPQGQQQQQQWPPQASPWQTAPQWAPQVADPRWPVGPQGVPLPAVATGVAVCAALATGLAVFLQLFWAGVHRTHSGEIVFWLSTAVLIIAGIVIAIMTAQDRRAGAGLAAIIGLAVPSISWNVYEAYFASNVNVPETQRHELLGTSVISLLAALVAALIALAALASRRQLGRQKADPLAIILLILGIIYPLTNILPQEKIDGFQFGNVLGSGVHGLPVLWGVIFLVSFALPPILSILLAPGSRAHIALWAGWVVLVLAWQLSGSPVDGEKAATGLVISWLSWVVVLICTLILTVRGPRAQPAVGVAGPAPVAGSQWPPNPV